MSKYFGTDGIRGIANDYFSTKLIIYISKSLGIYLIEKNKENPKVVIGYDTHMSSDMIENGFVFGLLSVGVDVFRGGIISTPGVAYLTRLYNADAGIMIAASHNPAIYNGIKIFDGNGMKISKSYK